MIYITDNVTTMTYVDQERTSKENAANGEKRIMIFKYLILYKLYFKML